MIILSIKTDNPKAKLGLYENQKPLGNIHWLADRQLADTINEQLDLLLKKSSKSLHDLQGIVIYKGPGSFTGLRIGFSVANALAHGLNIPIISAEDANWIETGVKALLGGKNEKVATPFYGRGANITMPKNNER